MPQLGDELRILPRLEVRGLEFLDRRHQRLGHEAPAEFAEVPAPIGIAPPEHRPDCLHHVVHHVPSRSARATAAMNSAQSFRALLMPGRPRRPTTHRCPTAARLRIASRHIRRDRSRPRAGSAGRRASDRASVPIRALARAAAPSASDAHPPAASPRPVARAPAAHRARAIERHALITAAPHARSRHPDLRRRATEPRRARRRD